MFEFLRSLFNPAPPSSKTAKERLRVVLLSDHLSLAPDVVLALKRDLLEVISRYVEIDSEHADVTFEQREREVAMLANIPITGLRERTRVEAPPAVVAAPLIATPPTAMPVSEAPLSEAPLSEAPLSEAPVSATSVSEPRVSEPAVSHTPASETPTSEGPATEAPADQPAPDMVSGDAPAVPVAVPAGDSVVAGVGASAVDGLPARSGNAAAPRRRRRKKPGAGRVPGQPLGKPAQA